MVFVTRYVNCVYYIETLYHIPLSTPQAKQVDKLVQMLITDRSKVRYSLPLTLAHLSILFVAHPWQINGFVLCGKLKNAYLVAIKARMVDEVQRISEIAFKAGQLSVRDICEKWLQTNSAAHR